MFAAAYRESEKKKDDFCRHGYALFRCLDGNGCVLGAAAALMDMEKPEDMQEKLSEVESLMELPVPALERAMLAGVKFPLPQRPMYVEEMDFLAARIAREGGQLTRLAQQYGETADQGDGQQISWARALVLAAVRTFDWKKDREESWALCRLFAQVEGQFISLCYNRSVLREGAVRVLPPMHRFGWYCGQAFRAFDAGDFSSYVKCLREGLSACREAKDMVEFLLEEMRERQRAAASPQLLALAEQVKKILARFQPDDPAVRQLLERPEYQKLLPLLGSEYAGLDEERLEPEDKEEEQK